MVIRPDSNHLLQPVIQDFLNAMAYANRSPYTLRSYGADLRAFAAFHTGAIQTVTTQILCDFLAQYAHLSPATRARKEAALASFFKWAYKKELIDRNPMARVDRVKKSVQPPEPLSRQGFERILAAVPLNEKRDRLLFCLLFETGLRIGEALNLYVEDVDLTPDDERITVLGKGGRRRTILLDDPTLVQQLRRFLKDMGYQHGPLFRAQKNYRGTPLRYQSIHVRWQAYCEEAGVECSFHQLRQGHATELINDNTLSMGL